MSLLRKFIHFRGLLLLEKCLNEHSKSKTIVRYNILKLIKLLPVSTKNAVLSLEESLKKIMDKVEYGEECVELVSEILKSWEGLEMVYRIPKRNMGDLVKNPTQEDQKRPKLNTSSRSGSDRVDSRSPYGESPYTKIAYISKSEQLQTQAVEDDTPALSWNTIIPKLEVKPTVTHVALSSASTGLSEDSIQQMVEAAQEATRLAQEEIKNRALKEEERRKKQEKKKKDFLQKQKGKYREILITASKKKREKEASMPKLQELSVELRQNIKSSVIYN